MGVHLSTLEDTRMEMFAKLTWVSFHSFSRAFIRLNAINVFKLVRFSKSGLCYFAAFVSLLFAANE